MTVSEKRCSGWSAMNERKAAFAPVMPAFAVLHVAEVAETEEDAALGVATVLPMCSSTSSRPGTSISLNTVQP
jgi:hypothetical protein